ncbi:hypothetical protein [Bacillus badius]|uniref:hypothetical protein n=1 Tax=Bacillus badius TaxID=1455 RepID=UPI0012DFFC63|nr:hypothetical protein [Bacillus badius]MED4717903.1 hypothetical protein [Bacillus badius]
MTLQPLTLTVIKYSDHFGGESPATVKAQSLKLKAESSRVKLLFVQRSSFKVDTFDKIHENGLYGGCSSAGLIAAWLTS